MKTFSSVENRSNFNVRKEAIVMNFNLTRINPNQTQVIFNDGRFETLTNEELDELLMNGSLIKEDMSIDAE